MDILDPLGPALADPLVKALPKADLHLHQEVTARLDRLAGSLRSRGSGTGTQKAVGSRQSAAGSAPADHPLPAAGSWASPNSGLLPTDPRSPVSTPASGYPRSLTGAEQAYSPAQRQRAPFDWREWARSVIATTPPGLARLDRIYEPDGTLDLNGLS